MRSLCRLSNWLWHTTQTSIEHSIGKICTLLRNVGREKRLVTLPFMLIVYLHERRTLVPLSVNVPKLYCSHCRFIMRDPRHWRHWRHQAPQSKSARHDTTMSKGTFAITRLYHNNKTNKTQPAQCHTCGKTALISLVHIDGLVQERGNSIAYALELHLSCTDPSIYMSEIPLFLLSPISKPGNSFRQSGTEHDAIDSIS